MNKIIATVNQYWSRIHNRLFLLMALLKVELRCLKPRSRKKHNLSGNLIVSLTTFPARFKTLPLTLKCLLTQSVLADKVILWIAEADKNYLTEEITKLEKKGLEIRYCDDLRSYKKIIPTLGIFGDAFIVTADDDLYYWSSWLEDLLISYNGNPKEVLCHRAHLINKNKAGTPLPYKEWEHETECHEASGNVFPTGVAGVLYPPKIFHSDVLDIEKFTKLCPSADDIWLYWMVRKSGGISRKIKKSRRLIYWPNSQKVGLWQENVSLDGNDQQISRMINFYGFPKDEK